MVVTMSGAQVVKDAFGRGFQGKQTTWIPATCVTIPISFPPKLTEKCHTVVHEFARIFNGYFCLFVLSLAVYIVNIKLLVV